MRSSREEYMARFLAVRGVEDDRFARRLFDPAFLSRVRLSSRPVIPRDLAGEVEDLVDRALLRAYERRRQFRGRTDDHLTGWVLRILLNLTRDILRRRRSESGLENPAVDPSIPPAPSSREEGGPAPGLLDEIPPADRDVLRLRLGMNLSVRETAELITRGGDCVSEAAVKMRFSRAVRRLAAAAERDARATSRRRPLAVIPVGSR
jgi:RNA polymerase sigma factor (sigma-70 family)